jgi:hypothetical protein
VVYIDGYFNPAAGWVESGAVVARLLEEARLAGVTIRTGEAFGRFLDSGSRVCGVITAAGDELPSDVVLVAAGAWTTTLVPELAEAMWPVAQPVFHLKPPDPDAWRPDRFTVWAADIARTGWYGFPANADGIVKIANHGPGRRVDPEAPRVTLAAEEAALQAFLHESLPALADAPLDASKTCLYSDTFDGDFWIGRDPDRDTGSSSRRSWVRLSRMPSRERSPMPRGASAGARPLAARPKMRDTGCRELAPAVHRARVRGGVDPGRPASRVCAGPRVRSRAGRVLEPPAAAGPSIAFGRRSR